jgi:hypothetical protein
MLSEGISEHPMLDFSASFDSARDNPRLLVAPVDDPKHGACSIVDLYDIARFDW